MCAGVSWGASEVCYFYIRNSFKGDFPHDYLKSSACTGSVNLTRAEITSVIPADMPRNTNSGITDRDCKCKVHHFTLEPHLGHTP